MLRKFISPNYAVYEVICKNIVEPAMYPACALHAGYIMLQTHSQNM